MTFFNEDALEAKQLIERLLSIFEKTALFVGLASVGFWLSNFHYADILITIGLLSVAFSYVLKGLYVKGNKKLNILTYRLGYFGSAFTIIVVWYRFLFWEGYHIYEFGGGLFLFLSLVLQLIDKVKFKKIEKVSSNYYTFFTLNKYRNLKFIFFLLIAIVSQTVSPIQLFEFRHSEDAEMIRLYKKTVEYPENNQYKKDLEEYQKNKMAGKRFLPESQEK